MSTQISVELSPQPEDSRVITDGLVHALQATLGEGRRASFSVFARACNGRIIGGVNARLIHEDLHIDQFWCAEEIRGQGYGSTLLSRAELYGREQGARAALLNTVEPTMIRFYGKRGYQQIGEVQGLAAGRPVYFLRKPL